jgi:hypothetical protein
MNGRSQTAIKAAGKIAAPPPALLIGLHRSEVTIALRRLGETTFL